MIEVIIDRTPLNPKYSDAVVTIHFGSEQSVTVNKTSTGVLITTDVVPVLVSSDAIIVNNERIPISVEEAVCENDANKTPSPQQESQFIHEGSQEPPKAVDYFTGIDPNDPDAQSPFNDGYDFSNIDWIFKEYKWPAYFYDVARKMWDIPAETPQGVQLKREMLTLYALLASKGYKFGYEYLQANWERTDN
jgi:hypothetical protein